MYSDELELFWSSVADWLTAQEITPAAVFGCIFICANLYARFENPAGNLFGESTGPFKLSDLVSRKRYWYGLTIYLASIVALYLLLLRIGEKAVRNAFNLSNSGGEFALYMAIVLAGLVPNVHGIDKIEEFFRRIGQRIAGIPPDHSSIFEKIDIALVQPEAISSIRGKYLQNIPDQKIDEILDPAHFDKWTKSILIFENFKKHQTEIDIRFVTVRASNRFREHVADAGRLISEVNNFIKDGYQTERASQSDQGNNEISAIEHSISRVYHLLKIILSGCIVSEVSNDRIRTDKILQKFGFSIGETVRPQLYGRAMLSILYSMIAIAVVELISITSTQIFFENSQYLSTAAIVPIVVPLTFAIPLYVGVRTYLKRRESRIRHVSRDWYITERPFTPHTSSRLTAYGVALFYVAIIAFFIDLVSWAALSSLESSIEKALSLDDAQFLRVVAVLLPAAMILFIFSYVVENDHHAAYSRGFADSYNKRQKRRLYSFLFGILCASIICIFKISQNIDLGRGLRNFVLDTPSLTQAEQRLALEATLNLGLQFTVTFLGVFVFFWVFYKTSENPHPS
ncbi:hypothetical protein ABWI00_07045 [Algihabitans albus]|uniref:hypothetical protein n=1 Tax=Algihabitans albus TaxID=2164067 RepID=UPI0035D07E25